MKRIGSIILTIMLAAALLAGCNNGSFKSSSFIAHKNEPTEKDILLISGTYKLTSIDGVDVKEYFNKLGSELSSNEVEVTSTMSDEEYDALIEKLQMILSPDGSAYVADLFGLSGKGYYNGEWRREGDTVVLTVYNGITHKSFNSETGETVTHSDTVTQFQHKDGVLTAISEDGEEGSPACVFTKISSSVSVPEMPEAPARETAPAKVDVGSAAGAYKIELIDGKDAVAYYSEKFETEDSLKTALELMEISSIDTLKDEMSFTLQPDGGVSFASIPEGIGTQRGSWTQDGSTVTVVLENDSISGSVCFGGSIMLYGNTTLQYNLQDDTLTGTTWGDSEITVVFRRN
ncbi:MAG: hypothetical protein IIY70_03670 [Oscillospiraceae bacterium]|nr:hypothetical protein [Oscillospiraceae bacterium]